MAQTSPTAVEPRPAAPPASQVAGLHPAYLAAGSALLLWLAYPPADRGYLAWVALVPLLLLARREGRRLTLYASAYLGGLIFWLLAVQWVRLTDPSAWLAWVVMAASLALWWPGFLALARGAVRRAGLPLMIAAPVIWVALELVRAYVLTGFPWYYLAHSQYRALPVIQIADIAGVWGISLLVALVNAWVVDLLTLPLLRPTPRGPRPTRPQLWRGSIVLAALAATLTYGGFRLATARFRPGPRLALLQSSFRQELKMGATAGEILEVYDALIRRAIHDSEPPDLIVWPETSFPYIYPTFEPGLPDSEITRQAQQVNPKLDAEILRTQARNIAAHLHSRADASETPMVVGLTVADYTRRGRIKYNAALLLEPNSTRETRYDKLHLVPFGEYVPLIQTFPWLTRLTPYHGELVPSLTPGVKPAWFDLNGHRYATAICFEDTVPQVVRRSFREAGGHPPDVLLNISNDGWFHGSSELDMHLAASIFRCVEHRAPLARAVNTGISAVIDGNGRIWKALPKATPSQPNAGVLVESIPLDDRTTLYTAWGDWLAWSCLAVTIGLAPVGWLRGRSPLPRNAPTPARV